jgi:hypothetical protein
MAQVDGWQKINGSKVESWVAKDSREMCGCREMVVK